MNKDEIENAINNQIEPCIKCGKFRCLKSERFYCNVYKRKIYTSIFWQKPDWCNFESAD